MELFDIRSNTTNSLDDCAELLIATVPDAMCMIRKDMRSHRPAELSIPQFRTLVYLRRHTDVSISAIADHLGLALSSTSQLIDGLVKRDYIARDVAMGDRRRAIVTLTKHGQTVLDAIYTNARARMAERLSTLSPEERQTVGMAMRILQRFVETAKKPE
ncbi:MAG TPA: MarR family transcriptional regulator [Armatimonadota bacterium]|nr:MarR family transcriptional regulator [Armatimonadota bacterium]